MDFFSINIIQYTYEYVVSVKKIQFSKSLKNLLTNF
jgi:hypothetical protein